MLFRLYQAVRLFYYPFFMFVFAPFSKSIRARISFEKRNKQDPVSRSFRELGLAADMAFEVSSEGELEQVRPALTQALEGNRRVELIFASDSVEKQCVALGLEFRENLRVFRFPLVSYFPGKTFQDPCSWLTAPKLFLCRYDFFPSLLRYGRRPDVEFILLSASLKSFENKSANGVYRGVYSKIYRSFDKIVAATDVDKQRFLEKFDLSSEKVVSFDFRPLAIAKRLERRTQTLENKFPGYESFQETIQGYPISRRMVFGSFWPMELEAITAKIDFSKHLLCFYPHRLDCENIQAVVEGMRERCGGVPVYLLGSDRDLNLKALEKFKSSPGPIVVNLKGVLCEAYGDFGAAFVGGGHGLSVHSLMEPFLSGCMVYCGPKVQRSTEYDLIREKNPDRIRIVDRLENVVENFVEDQGCELSDISGFKETYVNQKESALKWLGIV